MTAPSENMCDGGCGRELGVIRNHVEVEDGICIVCQHCFRVYKRQVTSEETAELYMAGWIPRKKRNGKGRLLLR